MPERKSNNSRARTRDRLLKNMTVAAVGRVEDITIPFTNDDVPTFLRNHAAFQKASREACIEINA